MREIPRIYKQKLVDFLFEKSICGIVVCDTDGSIITANPKFQKMLGYTLQELQGFNFQQITYPDDVIPSMQVYNNLIKEESDYVFVIKRYVNRRNDVIWAKSNAFSFKDKNEVVFIVIFIEPLVSAKDEDVLKTLKENKDKCEKFVKFSVFFLLFLLFFNRNF